MCRFIKIIVPALVVLFSAAEIHGGNTVKYVTICGRADPALSDTFHLLLKREFIYNNIGSENYSAVCDSNGYFSFRIPGIEHAAKFILYSVRDINRIVKNYYVENGDSIFISFNKKGTEYNVDFSGRGHEKFSCMYALETYKTRAFRQTGHLLNNNSAEPIDRLKQSFKWFDALDDSLLHILTGYTLSREMNTLLKSDIIGWNHKEKCLMLTDPFKAGSLQKKEKIRELFMEKIYTKIYHDASVYSDDYIEFLFRRAQDKILFAGKGYSMRQVYTAITGEYKGLIRDRVITAYLLRGHGGISNEQYEYCLNDALRKVQSPLYEKYLKDQLQRMHKGAAVYNFSLPDSLGNIISLSDFRGKLVLIDFWFTGCFSCTRLAGIMEKEVIHRYNDSSVVFMSICVDKEKEKWMKSVRSGKYTGARSVNLYTAGQGMNHPLVKYYNIQGCPRLLLIDRSGRIYAARPPIEGKELCELIDHALY